MEIKTAKFIISNTEVKKCPQPEMPEYAFIGRSNVGKSSLINMLTGRKHLAKISSKPGKTQLINHFLINENWYLVDLPGYGYAKVPIQAKNKWLSFIQEYILTRRNLMCTFVLIDSRHAPQKIDEEFMENLGRNGIPFVIVFTKTDKISARKLEENIKVYKEKMLQTWESMPQYFITSSFKKIGKKEILDFIGDTNKLF